MISVYPFRADMIQLICFSTFLTKIHIKNRFYILTQYMECICMYVYISEVKVTQLCPTLCKPMGLYSSWNSPVQNTGVGRLSLLQGLQQKFCETIFTFLQVIHSLSHLTRFHSVSVIYIHIMYMDK